MKQAITICLICMTFTLFGQDAKKLGKTFVMIQNHQAKKCDAVGNNQVAAAHPLERTFIILVEAMNSTGYVVSVPDFKSQELNNKFVRTDAVAEVKAADGTITTAKPAVEFYFFIPFTDFDKVAERAFSKHSFTVGIPTIPAKLRFGNGGKGEDARYFRFCPVVGISYYPSKNILSPWSGVL